MILVTGATGTVGSELVRQLLDDLQPVRVLVRDARKVAHLAGLAPLAEVAVGDLDKPETLAAAMQGVSEIFLVTFEASQDLSVLETAREAGVRHIVKLSTLEATDARIRIGKWSREREILIERSGIAWTFLRPGMFISNSIDWWAATIKEQDAVYFPGGKGKIAPIDPADIAAVAALALTKPGHEGCAYELTGSELFTIGEMVGVIGKTQGKPIQYRAIPPLAAGLWMLRSGMGLRLVAALMEGLSYLGRGEGAVVTNTVERLTGQPPRTFEAWCQAHVESFR